MLTEPDRTIVSLLQDNGRLAQVDIARAVGLTPSAVLERIRKLEARGVILGYTALVEPRVVGRGLLAFVAVRTAGIHDDEAIGPMLANVPEVLEVHHVAGEDCFLLKIRARDTEHLGELLRKRFGSLPNVVSTRTTIVLGTLKETSRLPVAASDAES